MANARHPWYLWGAFLLIVALVLAQNIYILARNPSPTGNAVDTATVSICVNTPPTLDISNCPPLAFTGTPYSCTVTGTDPQQSNLAYAVHPISGPAAGQWHFTLNGSTLSFTANESDIGTYLLVWGVNDQSGCTNEITTQLQNFTIANNTNAPFLARQLPNETWPYGTILFAFDLDNYFVDPNADVLDYAASGNDNIHIRITGGQVVLTPAASWCGVETVVFNATDPTSLTAFSNPVRLNVTCPPPAPPHTPSGGGSSGGGGGSSGASTGGGASATTLNPSCSTSYSCLDWSTCQLTRKVTRSQSDPTQVIIEGVRGSQTYTPTEAASLALDQYYEGYQWRDCIDTNQCSDSTTKTEVRPCSYQPSCFDGIKNQDETDVDCGGTVCKACGTCTDGVKNGLEEGVDCGGPFCQLCNTCNDGKLDGHETGVDCGGSDCAPCQSCTNGVKDGLETGVDCGGPFCPMCAEQQFPKANVPWLTIVLGILVLAVLLFLSAVFFKHQLASALLAFLFRHKRSNRTILLPADVKNGIVARLDALEQRITKQPILRSQEELARIIRDYFKAALGLEFEFTNEELVRSLDANKLNSLLSSILGRFFARINVLEFSGVAVETPVLRSLIQETRELVYQTAVLTVDDLRARELDLQLRDIPADEPPLDRAYLLLSQLQLAIQFHKFELAEAIYQVLQSWYETAPATHQRAYYEDFARVYDEFLFARGSRTVAGSAGAGAGASTAAATAGRKTSETD